MLLVENFVSMAMFVALVYFSATLVAEAQDGSESWKRHYVAGRELVLKVLAQTGETFIPEGSNPTIQLNKELKEEITDEMDQAVAEFKSALDSVGANVGANACERLVTLRELASSEARSHKAQDAGRTTELYKSQEKLVLDTKEKPFVSRNRTCPVCELKDAVVKIQYGLLCRGGDVSSDRINKTTEAGRMQALLRKDQFGGCLIYPDSPTYYCNRCDLGFMVRK